MKRTRREFHQQAATCLVGAVALASDPQLLAAPPKAKPQPARTPTLVAVYLRGGADLLGTIPPFADKRYREVHPSLAIAGPDTKGPNSALPLDDRFGFNPNLRELHALYEHGMCVPMVCVGSPDGTRSHFDAQDFMERGAPGQKMITTGWLNRYLEQTRSSNDANLRAISLHPLLPRSLRGGYAVLARPNQTAELAMQVYAQLYPQQKGSSGRVKTDAFGSQTRRQIQEFGARTIEQLAELNAILDQPQQGTAKYPQSTFGRQLRDIAKVIKANRGLEVTALDYGGWDHHINEGPIDGQLGKNLADVSASVGAFVNDLGPAAMEHVLILIMSEFGRTVKENGNRGTDHGHGGFMLAVGGRLNGKKVYGKWTGLEDNQLYQSRDLPVHTDFRDVFAETLKGVFKFDAIKAGLFPRYRPQTPPLDFISLPA